MEFEKLLIEVSTISKKYEDAARLTGENFNIFNVLKLSTREVRTHSAFIAELLNPEGSHDQGDIFLRLFLKQLEISIDGFNYSTAKVKVEKYIGTISDDKTEGGFIDIIIFDNNRHEIIIENKIYAGDQENQLLRYYKYGTRDLMKPDLLYLTLDGKTPSDFSIGKNKDIEYINISYKDDIKNWLDRCREKTVNHPILRETITQYIHLIKNLTGQTMNEKMKKEIKELIRKNPDYSRSIIQSHEALQAIISEAKLKFKNGLNELLHEKEIYSDNGLDIIVDWDEDANGVYIGYYIKNRDNANISDTADAVKYKNIMKNISPNIQSSNYYVGWYYPAPFKESHKFNELDIQIIIDMNEGEYLRKFINGIITEEKEIRKMFLDLINRNK